jgi:hypothetical protein
MGGKPLLPQLLHGIQAFACRARKPVLGISGLGFERKSGSHFWHVLIARRSRALLNRQKNRRSLFIAIVAELLRLKNGRETYWSLPRSI